MERYPKALGIRETIVYDYYYTNAKEPWALHSPLIIFKERTLQFLGNPTLMLVAICHLIEHRIFIVIH